MQQLAADERPRTAERGLRLHRHVIDIERELRLESDGRQTEARRRARAFLHPASSSEASAGTAVTYPRSRCT